MVQAKFGAHFDGSTYSHQFDYDRLTNQMKNVWRIVNDGRWYTLKQISNLSGYPEASVSARLRDFRKDKFGALTVNRQRLSKGLFQYQVLPNGQLF